MTFEAIRKAAEPLGTMRGTLGDAVDDILDKARINADDTVFVEKSSEDWDAMAMASLEGILSVSTDPAACDWFRNAGVRW